MSGVNNAMGDSSMKSRLVVLSLVLALLATSQSFGQIPQSLTWGIEDGKIAIRSDVSYGAVGADFASAGGSFVPLAPAESGPFLFLLSNTPDAIVFASVPAPATVPAFWDTGIGYSGPVAEIEDDVLISLGTGPPITTEFPLNPGDPLPTSNPITFTFCDRPGLPVDCVPEPTSCLMLCVPLLGLGWMRKRRTPLP